MEPKFNVGDAVRIQSDYATLPMPQSLYAGQPGVVKDISELNGPTKYYVAPEKPLSGADTRGIPFYESELKPLHE